MFLTLVQIGIVAYDIYTAYRSRQEAVDARAARADDFQVPRAEEGDAIPIGYGTFRVDSPVAIDFAVAPPDPIPDPSSGAIVSYRYMTRIRLLLCRTNARVEQINPPMPTMTAFLLGDLRADISSSAALTPGARLYQINERSGNETDGRTGGFLYFYDGRWDLDRVPLVDGDATSTIPTVPWAGIPYRGYVTISLQSWSVDGPNLATYSPIIYNPCVIPGYEAQTGALGNGDCNPIAILYDLFTNPFGGLGFDDSALDMTSFIDAAVTLRDEQFGMSLLVTKPNEARDVIAEVLRTIDGVVYWDTNAGTYVIKLIRADYTVGSLPEFTESDIIGDPEKTSTLWTDTYNEVKVVFTERSSGDRPSTATAQDLAGIAINGGRIRSTEIHFPGVRDADLANRLANRELNFLCRPIDTLKITVNRRAWNLKPGDPFVFTFAPWSYTNVFRVMEIDFGTLERGEITITAVQDRFSTVGNIWDPPIGNEVFDPPATPTPIVHRLVTECPRFIQRAAWNAGTINNADAQRGFSAAIPEGADSRYRVDSSLDGDTEETDAPARAFPLTFAVALDYVRTTDAYDTSSGITVEDVAGGTFASATAAQIRATGRNLVALWDDDGHHEILAFEAAADLGGGQYQLQNVWRGLLDTVPHDWPAGSYGCVLPGTSGTSAMGRRVYPHGTDVATHMPAASGSTWTPADASPVDELTSRSRVLLPARVADLLLNGSAAPAALEEDGVTFAFTDRNSSTATVVRGDAADETVEAGQTHDAVGYKGGLPEDGATETVIKASLTSHTTPYSTAVVGHGDLELGVVTRRAVPLPDGTTPTLDGWQVPTVAVHAHHWRNLIINPRFADGLNGWTATNAAVASATPLGGTGYYVRGATGQGDATIEQTVGVSGYLPAHMTARLQFYPRKLTDSDSPDDTATVVLESLTAAGASIATATYGPLSPTTWEYQELELADLDATTAKLKVTITLDAIGTSGDTTADTGVAELCLRLGQQSSQLLTNPSFEASGGGFSGWTETVGGTWQVFAVSGYESTYYLRPQNVASAQLRQTVSVPAGYLYSAAILECARKNDDVNDTGTVTLEALDGGGSVLDSVTTGAEALTPSNWARRRLVLDPIPGGTVNLRVTLDAARVTGVTNDAAFDNFRLFCHKHLDADQTIELAWDALVEQPLPQSAMAWKFAFPTVDPPDYALYDGAATGKLGIEPVLQSFDGGVTALLNGTAVVNGTTTTAYECLDRDAGAFIETAPLGTAFGNFASADSFTAIVFCKASPGVNNADGFGICGRVDEATGTTGWEMRLTDTDGFPWVRLTGDGGSVSRVGTVTACDGSLHGFALIYDGNAQTLTLVDASGTYSTSTAAIGELQGGAGKLRILFAGLSEAAAFEGQVPRLYLWRSALSTTDVGHVLAFRDSDPTGRITSDGRTGSIVCVTSSDATFGVRCETFGPGRTAIAYDGTAYGLVTMPAIGELSAGATGLVDTGTVADDAAIDPLGFRRAIRIEGDDTEGRTYTEIDPGSAGTVYVSFMARADVAHSMTVALDDGGGGTDSATVLLTTTWAVYNVELDFVDTLTTGLCDLRFAGSNDGTTREVYLSPTMCVSTVKPFPGTFPVLSPGATAPVLDVTNDDAGDALTAQVNGEGELSVTMALVDVDSGIGQLWNGTNTNDQRTIRWDADPTTPNVKSDHYTGSGTNNTNAQLTGTAIVPTTAATYRLRWNRASTLDGLTMQTRLQASQGATTENDTGRNTSWTPSTTPVDTLDLGHEGGSSVAAGLIYAAAIRVREGRQ